MMTRNTTTQRKTLSIHNRATNDRQDTNHLCKLLKLPKELVGDILSYGTLKDYACFQGTCTAFYDYVSEFLPLLQRSFDWVVENGQRGGLEYLYRYKVPVESISLDMSAVVNQSAEKKIPIGDPLQFLSHYSAQTSAHCQNCSPQNTTSREDTYFDQNQPADRNKNKNYKNLTSIKNNKNCLFRALRTLVVRGMYSTYDAGLVALTHFRFPNLRILILSHLPTLSSLTVQRLLPSAPLLQHLSLERSYNAATDETLSTLAHSCPYLRTLSLAYCSLLTDEGLALLTGSTNSNQGNELTNTHNSHANKRLKRDRQRSYLEHLQEVSLAHCYELSSPAIAQFVRHLHNLMVFSLEWCFHVDDDVLLALAQTSNNLTVLGIEHCERITDTGLANVLHRKPRLMFLSADSCPNIAQATAKALAERHERLQLQDLYLNSCTLLTDADVQLIAKYCTQLRSVGIEDCAVSDQSVITLAKNCPYLTVLGLNNNPLITDKGLDSLVHHLAHSIERLYLSETTITNKSLFQIATQCTQLLSLSLIHCEHISYDGLRYLGDPDVTVCAATLQDLHLSSNMRNKARLYQHFPDHHRSEVDKHANDMQVEDDSEVEQNESASPATVTSSSTAITWIAEQPSSLSPTDNNTDDMNSSDDEDGDENDENIEPNTAHNDTSSEHTSPKSNDGENVIIDVQYVIFGTSSSTSSQTHHVNHIRKPVTAHHIDTNEAVTSNKTKPPSQCIIYFR